MAKGTIVMFVFVVLAMVQVLMVKPGQAALTCNQVDACLAPCIPYLTAGGTPSGACCDGVKNLKGISSSSVADKKVACNCVKAAAARYTNIKDDAASALPTKCGVAFDIPISRNTNCDIKMPCWPANDMACTYAALSLANSNGALK